jgi:hypothetical protein
MEFRDAQVSPEELTRLLERLEGLDEPVSDHASTVSAVVEATGYSSRRVWEALQQIRSEDLEARLAAKLRELEEPLYRVERPYNPAEKPLAASYAHRHRILRSLLDDLPRPGEPRVRRPVGKPDLAERAAGGIAMALLAGFALLVLTLVLGGAITALRP